MACRGSRAQPHAGLKGPQGQDVPGTCCVTLAESLCLCFLIRKTRPQSWFPVMG